MRHRDAAFESGDMSPHATMWPHAPVHYLAGAGVYMVTAGTYRKQPYLNTPTRLDLVMRALFACLAEGGWELYAWAVLSNHYHFVARSPGDAATLPRILGKLHMTTAKVLNQRDRTPGRRVWFQYWDTHLTFERSYLARLRYVNQNPVHHGITHNATTYPWCSAAWFEANARPAFVKTVSNFKADLVRVPDEF